MTRSRSAVVAWSAILVVLGMIAMAFAPRGGGGLVGLIAIMIGVSHYQRSAPKRLTKLQITGVLVAIFLVEAILYAIFLRLVT